MVMSKGADIDIETGLPIVPEESSRKAKEEKRIGRMISTYQAIVNDLAGDGGAVLEKIAGLYINRVNKLVQEDPECRGYQAVFDELKMTINVGKILVTAKMEEVEKAQQ